MQNQKTMTNLRLIWKTTLRLTKLFESAAACICNVRQCVAVSCSVLEMKEWRRGCLYLQCVAVCGSELQCVGNERMEARRAAERTSAGKMLQCVAVCCSALQCVAVCCSVL